jgi:Family of unknown function (DUF6527)
MRNQSHSSKRADHLKLRARVDSRDEARRLVIQPGDAVLIVRGRPRSVVMGCPCGCGDQLTINLDSRSGPAWRFVERHGEITLYPSVWRESGCKSHFVVWQNRIYLYGQNEFKRRRHLKLEGRVYKQLADGQARHFADIADQLDELPWTVLVACGNLAADGEVRELEEPNRGTFIRRSVT